MENINDDLKDLFDEVKKIKRDGLEFKKALDEIQKKFPFLHKGGQIKANASLISKYRQIKKFTTDAIEKASSNKEECPELRGFIKEILKLEWNVQNINTFRELGKDVINKEIKTIESKFTPLQEQLAKLSKQNLHRVVLPLALGIFALLAGSWIQYRTQLTSLAQRGWHSLATLR